MMDTASSVGSNSCGLDARQASSSATPDLVRYAQSFGAAGYRVTESSELPAILREALQQHVPTVIDCPIDYRENIRLTDRLNRLAP